MLHVRAVRDFYLACGSVSTLAGPSGSAASSHSRCPWGTGPPGACIHGLCASLCPATRYARHPQDQRGTGQSTPITPDNLARRGSPAEQAAYLKFFRQAEINVNSQPFMH